MADLATGLFHFVFGKRGPKGGAAKPWAEAPSESPADAAAPGPSPADAAPEPAIAAEEAPATPEPAPEPQSADPAPTDSAAETPQENAAQAPTAEAAPEPELSAQEEQPPEEPPAPEPEQPVEEPAPQEPAAEAPVLEAEPAPLEPTPLEPPPIVFPPPTPAIDPSMRLTPNFTLHEFIRSAKATEKNIDNLPDEAMLANIRVAAEGMERVRALIGGKPIHITSGYRCPALNAAVGGSDTSDHMGGFSVDFGINGVPHYEVAQKLSKDEAFMAGVDQLIYEFDRWVHVSFAPRRRREVKTAHYHPESGKKTRYTPGVRKLTPEKYLAPD
ncbi:MAG TPA: D-Ala-D-Ala carboxypeptidase family metallohydrolase [Terricaulis sp.]|nr:D-Ala-D-Ala carboxypeptidase family metallohydrolase [Terricaulis sp.]